MTLGADWIFTSDFSGWAQSLTTLLSVGSDLPRGCWKQLNLRIKSQTAVHDAAWALTIPPQYHRSASRLDSVLAHALDLREHNFLFKRLPKDKSQQELVKHISPLRYSKMFFHSVKLDILKNNFRLEICPFTFSNLLQIDLISLIN